MDLDPRNILDSFDTIQKNIESLQNQEASIAQRRADIYFVLNETSKAKNENPNMRPALAEEERQLAIQINQVARSIQAEKQKLKELSIRDEERALERFKTTLTEENNKFQEQFNRAVTEKQEFLAQRERIANNAETRERVVEVQRSEHNDLGKIIAAGIIGAVLFG